MRSALRLLFLNYHRFISPWLPAACRFHPPCSVYASDAVQQHGVCKGLYLFVMRLSRCQPWNPGGYDPVN